MRTQVWTVRLLDWSCRNRAHMVYECSKALDCNGAPVSHQTHRPSKCLSSQPCWIFHKTPRGGVQRRNVVAVYQTPSFPNKHDNHATNPNKWRQGEARGGWQEDGFTDEPTPDRRFEISLHMWAMCSSECSNIVRAAVPNVARHQSELESEHYASCERKCVDWIEIS